MDNKLYGAILRNAIASIGEQAYNLVKGANTPQFNAKDMELTDEQAYDMANALIHQALANIIDDVDGHALADTYTDLFSDIGDSDEDEDEDETEPYPEEDYANG